MRFYTVPDAKTARISVVWAMVLIGAFYIMTTFLGFGAATIVGPDFIMKNGGTNMSAPLLAQFMAGDIFFAFISAVAFATILAVVAGLTISASTSFAHDFWTNVIHRGVGAQAGRNRAGGADRGVRRGRCRHAIADPAGTGGQRSVPGGAGVGGGGFGQSAGDRASPSSGSASTPPERSADWSSGCCRSIGLILISPTSWGSIRRRQRRRAH